MQSSYLSALIRALAIAIILASAPVAAQEDISQLKQQIEELERKVRLLQDRQATDTEAARTRVKGADFVTAGHEGFGVTSGDNGFELKLHGDLQVDSRSYHGTGSPGTSGTPAPDTLLVRRARPIIEATLYDIYDFRMMPDFAGSQTVLFDAYGQARFTPQFQLRAGKFKPPVGLEQLQVDDNLFFAERSLATDLVPIRDVGFQVQGEILEGKVAYALGIFNGVVDSGNAASGDIDGNSGKDAAARLFARPFRGRPGPLHGLGFGLAYTDGRQTGTLTAASLPTYKTIGQQNFFSYVSGAYAFGTRQRLSPQLYYYLGPFGLLTEYVRSSQAIMRAGFVRDVRNTAWNVTVGWVLTGEESTFIGVTPRRPFSPGTSDWGAFQVVARASKLTVGDDAFDGAVLIRVADPTVSAREARDSGIGLNWYLSRLMRIDLAYDQTRFSGGAAAGDRPAEKVLISRFQFAF